jgi:hypothetical protein
MGVYRPHLSQMSWKEESAYKETPTQGAQTFEFGLLKEEVSLPDPDVNYDPVHIIGGGRDAFMMDKNEIVYEGSIPMLLATGELLVFGLGKSVRTGADPYVHTITWDDPLPSMVIEAVLNDASADFVRYFRGVKVNKMTLDVESKGSLKCTLDVIAAVGEKTTNTKSTIDMTGLEPYRFFEGVFSIWGTEFARLQSFSLSVDNSLEAQWYIQSTNGHDPYEVDEGPLKYDMKATIVAADTSIFEHIGTDTPFDFSLKFTRSANDYLEIKDPTARKCYLKSAPHNIPTGANIPVELSLLPTGVEFEVKDSIASYPNETT